MNILLFLVTEFSKIGLFAIGGGYAILLFLYHLSVEYHWFDPKYLTQMLAISSIMPGPIGINLAAQTGFIAANFWGALAAVIGIMIPSLVFVFIISKILKEFKHSKVVRSIFYILKPTSCGMVMAIGFKLLKDLIFIPKQPTFLNSFDWLGLALFLVLLFLSIKKKHSPLFYLGISALVGVFVQIVKPFILG